MYQRCNRRIQLPENKRPWRVQKEESLEPAENSRFPRSLSIPLTRKPEDSSYKIAFSSLSTKCSHFMGKTKIDVSLIIFPKREFILSCLTPLSKRWIILLQSIDLCPADTSNFTFQISGQRYPTFEHPGLGGWVLKN